MRFEGSTRDDLLLYFWYLRSTTLALGVAFLVSAVYLKINTGFTSCWGMTLGELLCAGFLFFLSRDYKENLDRSFDSM
jgi:pheromone shutdown protein TraB